ncbi:MAG: hypothetical protein IT348_03375 [Candidatus Eisenbacteria bacterium]|nr:hypothetical protein [Candidatus Eisenbacteria bacterium]
MKLRLAAASLLAITLAVTVAFACGPDLPWAAFTHQRHPDTPLVPYAGGQLGVLQPTYARSYLVVAYRWLSGVPLTKDEQSAAVDMWRRRSEAWWSGPAAEESAPAEWMAARAQLAGLPPVPEVLLSHVREGSYTLSQPAGLESFRAATRVLNQRLAAENARSASLRAWALAQDTVFAIVAGEDLSLADSPAVRTDPDRLYQLAAVAFHRGAYGDAEPAFRLLAAGPGARMKPWCAYMAVRCVVRAAQESESDSEPSTVDRAAFERADRELAAILADAAQRDAHAAARRLQGFVAFRLRPVARLGELSRALRQNDPNFGQDVWDFALLLDGVTGEPDSPGVLAAGKDALVTAAAADELADWVLTFQRGPDAFPRALVRWRVQRSLPWLVAALACAPAGAREVSELLDAAAGVAPVSPAFATIGSHRARLLAARGDVPGARRALDSALARPALPVGSRNALLAQRAALAADMAALLADLPRAPANILYGGDVSTEPTPLLAWEGAEPDSARAALLARRHRAECFDADGAALFNRALPLSRWQEAAESAALPARLRRELALAGWTRAVLLADSARAAAFAVQARALEPSLAADLAEWERATTAGARAFAAALLIGRRPGMQPFVNSGLERLEPLDRLDDYRDNWWASRDIVMRGEYGVPVGEAATGATFRDAIESAPPAPAFLTPAERAAAASQMASLARAQAAPGWLGDRILAFARSHPRDPRVPEALHRLVRAVRLGASDERGAAQAREAFQLLHKRYPGNAWTRRTKSWGV